MSQLTLAPTGLIDEGLAAVEAQLMAAIDSEVELLADASRHILSSGGKRTRPLVAFLCYFAAGGEDLESVVPMATAVEMVHTATLVHDDINDHSLTRRGKPSVHARWGRTFALLTGDYLFTKVYELMAPYGAEYNIVMSAACSDLVEGETLQAAAAKEGDLDSNTYKRIISLKTASLFEATARMAGRLAGAERSIVNALATYAHNLGLTFQIVDDVLDIIGDPDTLGKPVGNDLVQGRGVMAANSGMLSIMRVDDKSEAWTDADSMQGLLVRLRESGAVELARTQARDLARLAKQSLAAVPPSPARDELDLLVDRVLDRDQ